ncbi:RNA polymerase sigma-70 factor [Larkinella sp. GY13]|uniref:RNA polymerase sigma-70 factor n=1 Tax=Larkinella sp. GY13 TaxID=3453720 RepID=UPI003EE84D46
MAENNPKQNPINLTTPIPQREEVVVMDSEYLIRQAFATDIHRGYELLFRRYYKVLCNQAVRFTYARDVAEDIVADIFMGFWKNKVHEHITTSYRAYLYQSVRNRVYNHLQNEFRQASQMGKPVELDAVADAVSEDPQSIIQCTELYQRLEKEVKLLPPQCQRVFVLSRFEGKKQREIAEELQISLKAVEAHIQRALLQLRKVIHVGIIVWITAWLLK